MSSHSTRSGTAPSLLDEILSWPPLVEGGDVDVLNGYLANRAGRLISRDEVEATLRSLCSQELVERSGAQIRLSEPDRRELDLYGPLEALLQTSTVFGAIGVASREFVFQKTATGGLLGDGRLSRPDFTLAAIRSWRFDPQRTLEVYSFEVKNRAGASVSAVYEAVAHGRFAHHPYLVCPRSRFDPTFNSEILDACVREGIGLITFDIVVPIGGSFEVGGVQVVSQAERRSPDPQLVERHLERRLYEENRSKLETYARGTPS